MIWKYFYNINSASEHGTLYQLRNKINRTNVVKNPKSNYNACGDFLETVVVGHVLGAAMQILEISNLNDQPSDVAVGITSAENLWTFTSEERESSIEFAKRLWTDSSTFHLMLLMMIYISKMKFTTMLAIC